MRNKILVVLGIFLLFSACKKDQENQNTENLQTDNSLKVSKQDIEKLDYTEFILDDKAQDQIKDWTEYYTLQDIIDSTKKGDLSFFIDNEQIPVDTFEDFKLNTPEFLKSPSISARILVIETKIRKLESLANLTTTSKQELKESIKELLVAFSNLNLQINKKVEFDSINIEKPQ